MTHLNYQAPAELYLGRDWISAEAQGPRTFRTAANAIRFALEEAAPVSLHGARLKLGDTEFSGDELKELYRRADYPLPRKGEMTRKPRRLVWQRPSTGKRQDQGPGAARAQGLSPLRQDRGRSRSLSATAARPSHAAYA
jgi:hypothetical protein